MVMRGATHTRLRKQAEGFLTDTCVIERLLVGQGEFMTPQNVWRIIGSGVRCRIITQGRSFASQVQTVAEQETLKEEYRIVLPLGTDIQANDRILNGNTTYTVVRMETRLTDEFFIQATIANKRGADYE